MQSTVTEDTITAISEHLAERVGPQKYRIWFRHSTRLAIADGYLKVGVPNLFIASWIENHFSNELNQAARRIIERVTKAANRPAGRGPGKERHEL